MRKILRLATILAGLALATEAHSVALAQARRAAAARSEATAGPSTYHRFDRVLLLETTSETSANVSIGDVNGDGNLDIVLVKGRHWPLKSRVLVGDGRGHFAKGYDLGDKPYRSYSGRLVDIDGDGDLDVVLSNDAPDPKLVYLNDGKGRFRPGSSYGRGEWETRNATVADLDGDGQPDIVVANRPDKDPANYICLNRGKGRFDANALPFSHESATTITATDFNHDGLIDLAVPNRDGGQSYVYIAVAKATYSSQRQSQPPAGPIRRAEAGSRQGP